MAVGFPHTRLIARLRAIASLTDADAKRIEALPMKVQNLRDGHSIVREGDISDQCCLLVEGFLYRHKNDSEGQRQILSWHVPGDIPDLYSLHLNPMDHNLSALGSAVVAFISHAHFQAMLDRSPSLTHVFWRETLVDGSVFREWVMSMGKRSGLERIAHMLCELIARLRAVGLSHDGRFSFPGSQVDIADAAGMTPIHANRMIQQLRAKKLVVWNGDRIEVPDFDALRQAALFEDSYLHLRNDPQPAVRPLASSRGGQLP
jgi:CRP-like cAMP-binding protein